MSATSTALVLLTSSLVSCREATQITFEVRTDLSCAEVNDTTITVGTVEDVDRKPATSTAVKTTCIDGRIGALVAAPSEGNDVEIGVRVVTGVGQTSPESCVAPDYRGCIVARRALKYIPHTPLRVNIPMRANCKDVPCDAAGFSTCASGRCVSARIDSASCEGAGCEEPPAPSGTCATAPSPAGVTASGWTPIASLSTIGEKGRSAHTAVWTCTELLVWGGGDGSTSANKDLLGFAPATNTWRRIGPAPIGERLLHTAIWTGKEMIVWGGLVFIQGTGGGADFLEDGASYDPATNQWAVIPPDPIASERLGHAAVWSTTTSEMIIFSGRAKDPIASGAAFDPATRRWRAIANAPSELVGRYFASAVFVNDRMIVYGGTSAVDDQPVGTAAAYDPKTDSWTMLPSPSAGVREQAAGVIGLFGGKEGAFFYGGGPNDGAFFDGASWTTIAAPPANALPSPARITPYVWFGGGRAFVWGGTAGPSNQRVAQATGALFDPSNKTWSALPASPLSARSGGTATWTGRYAILVGGGGTNTGPLQDGAIFVP